MFALPVECYVVAEGDDIDEKSYDDLQPQFRRFGRQSPYMVETFYQIVSAHLPPANGFDRCHNRVPPNV